MEHSWRRFGSVSASGVIQYTVSVAVENQPSHRHHEKMPEERRATRIISEGTRIF